jgi:hypothetical protein
MDFRLLGMLYEERYLLKLSFALYSFFISDIRSIITAAFNSLYNIVNIF